MERWQGVHGTPRASSCARSHPTAPRPLEPDLADYSFDRAVICDRARTVDLLLANNFHFENNCAVLSVDGYPPGPSRRCGPCSRRNPRLQVFALHDATPAAAALAHRLATDPEWFQGLVRVDRRRPAARPTPAPSGPVLASRAARCSPATASRRSEAAWLSQLRAGAGRHPPGADPQALFRALNRREPSRSGDGGDVDGSWSDIDSSSLHRPTPPTPTAAHDTFG